MPPSAMILAVQALYGAFERRDIDSMLAALTDDVVWCEPPNPYNPAGGARHGHAGFLEWVRIGREAEEILALETRQFLTRRGLGGGGGVHTVPCEDDGARV